MRCIWLNVNTGELVVGQYYNTGIYAFVYRRENEMLTYFNGYPTLDDNETIAQGTHWDFWAEDERYA